jgi:hypothetical protein
VSDLIFASVSAALSVIKKLFADDTPQLAHIRKWAYDELLALDKQTDDTRAALQAKLDEAVPRQG